MTSEQLRAVVMADRSERGLALRFVVPGRPDIFTCYAKDDAQKTAWLERAEAKGWSHAQ